MKRFLKILLATIIVLGVQLAGSLLLLHSHIIRWGATDNEVTMPMSGDKYAEVISSTRAIDIHKPQADVWAKLVDLGADRKGFYSFSILENLVGCKISNQMNGANRELHVGRLIPITSPDAHGNYKKGFVVIEVDQGQSFVLEGWGTFAVNKIDENSSRLLIRTNGKAPHHLIEKLGYSIFDMLHYIMEKRMMLGIKDNAESGGQIYTSTSDWIWILSLVIAGLTGLFMVFTFNGYYKLLIPTILFTIWQLVFFVLNPKALYGVLLVIFAGALIFIYQTLLKDNKKNHRGTVVADVNKIM